MYTDAGTVVRWARFHAYIARSLILRLCAAQAKAERDFDSKRLSFWKKRFVNGANCSAHVRFCGRHWG